MNSFENADKLTFKDYHLEGLAREAWNDILPEFNEQTKKLQDPYAPCPCGCGEKFKYVYTDEGKFEAHEKNFIDKWVKAYKEAKLKV